MEVEHYEDLLKDVYRTAPIGLCLFDTELRYRHINEWLASINGLSVKAHLGRTIGEVIPDISVEVESILRGVMETGEPVLDGIVEAETPASPHQKRIFQHSYHVVKSDEGIVVGVSCIVQDVTERRRAEDALVQARNQLEERVQARTAELTHSELRQRVLLESTHAVPWEADATTWQFTYVGPQATDLLGYPPQQWLDIDFWTSRIHPDDREFAIDYCVRSAKCKANFDFEYRMITADGRTVWIHDIVSVESEDGKPKTLRGFMIDITERKQAQQNFASLLEAAPDAIIIVNQAGTIVLINAQTESLFGFDRENLIGQSVEILLPARLRSRHVQYRQDYFGKPRVRAMGSGLDLMALHKDGHEFPVEVSLSPCQTSEGQIVIGSVRDVTEQRHAQAEIRRSHDDMRALARRLISAHEDERRRIARELHDDLSQRLASIAIDSSSLVSEVRPATEASADKLASLSDRIRQASMDVHQVSRRLHPSIVDELGLVKAIQSECHAFQERSGIALRYEGPSKCGSIAKSTELAAYRMVQECLRNVEKHSRAVSARVELSVSETEISLIVTDTGTGFDPTKQREKAGLGMASLKERAGLLGGTVSIQSELGRGTTVTAHLPLKRRES